MLWFTYTQKKRLALNKKHLSYPYIFVICVFSNSDAKAPGVRIKGAAAALFRVGAETKSWKRHYNITLTIKYIFKTINTNMQVIYDGFFFFFLPWENPGNSETSQVFKEAKFHHAENKVRFFFLLYCSRLHAPSLRPCTVKFDSYCTGYENHRFALLNC